MPRGRTKVANPETAQRILAAAETHFAAQGMAGARTEEIASAAHANKAMLYYYFGDKRRLHRAVLENLFRQLGEGAVLHPERSGTTARASARAFRRRVFRSSGVASGLPAARAARSDGGDAGFRSG